MKYPKINTIWNRNEKDKFKIIEGDYCKEEFNAINRWMITEKIDGTNIRVYFNPIEKAVYFKGRTDVANIPSFLLDSLNAMFNTEKLLKVFPEGKEIILYGEGFGHKIQSVGDKYRKDNSFILFDVWVDGWWLQMDNVVDIASKLEIESVPILGVMTTDHAIEYLKEGNESLISDKELVAEGIVARSYPLMLFRNGDPIMWKLKVRDYTKLHSSNQTKESEK
jgi:ATP-dependent RNA circularization protein (DNA/RNA ligase family)